MRTVHSLSLLALFIAPSALAELPPAPTVPAAPEALAAAIATFSERLATVASSCQDQGERSGGDYDERRCPKWLASIRKGGEAATWALLDGLLGEETLDLDMASTTEGELYAILKKSRHPALIPALLRGLAYRAPKPEETSPNGYRDAGTIAGMLAELTGVEAAPRVGDDDYLQPEDIAIVANGWLTWWNAHKTETPEAWRAYGLAEARKNIEEKDAAARFGAVRRLMAADGDRELAIKALTMFLSSPEITSDDAWKFESLARRFKVPADAIAAMMTAREGAAKDGVWAESAKQKKDELDSKRLLADCQEAFYDLRLEASLVACTKAWDLNKTDSEALVGRGWAELELGKTEEALATATEAIDLTFSEYNDEQSRFYQQALQLRVAALTADGEDGDAKDAIATALEYGAVTGEVRVRNALLRGRPAPKHWVKYVAPRYFCWRGKGDEAAKSYLLRRGFIDPKVFEGALAAMTPKQRTKLETKGTKSCPWSANVSAAQ